jgi:hypothetical protein
VADDSVIVSKSRPEKPGNRVEDKTGMTCDRVYRGRYEPKAMDACEGRKFIRRFPKLMLREAGHKPPDGVGHFASGEP